MASLSNTTNHNAIMAYSKLMVNAKCDPTNRAVSGSFTSSLSENDIDGNIFYYYSLQPALTGSLPFITGTNATASFTIEATLDKSNWLPITTYTLLSATSSVLQFTGKYTDVRILTSITGSNPALRPNATASLFIVASSS